MSIHDAFKIAAPEGVDVRATLHWETPVTHDVLFSGEAPKDDEAYFYAIVAKEGHAWMTYYLGMVYDQFVSDRHRASDHLDKMSVLRQEHPDKTFHLSLAVLTVQDGLRVTKKLIESIEGLLIFANWHGQLTNEKKINDFSSRQYFHIQNEGFTHHLDTDEIAYGVFYR